MASRKDTWAQWDRAWDLNRPAEERLVILKAATAPTFTYSNANALISDGDLEQLVQLIDQLLQATGNRLTVKHINWWEHHDQSALQWDMIDISTGATAMNRFSYARYTEDHKLLSVTDFW
jgi:hypothetical protein